MPSPSPRCSVSRLFVLESFTEGEEWTDIEVTASLECSGKASVSFAGSTSTGRDRSVLGTPFVNVSVASMLFVWVTDGFWSAVTLPFFILPDAKTEEEHASKLLEWWRKSGFYLGINNAYSIWCEYFNMIDIIDICITLIQTTLLFSLLSSSEPHRAGYSQIPHHAQITFSIRAKRRIGETQTKVKHQLVLYRGTAFHSVGNPQYRPPW